MSATRQISPDGPLPPGVTDSVDGSAREQLSEIQRGRILAAMLDVASERGAGNVTVAHVVARSGVSRRTFYEIFADREHCLMAALDEALGYASARLLEVDDPLAGWEERIRAGLLALLDLFDEQPAVGRLLIVETLGAGTQALRYRQAIVARLVVFVDRGRREAKRADDVPALTAEGVVGAVLSIVHDRLLASDPQSLRVLLKPLMGMIVLPYLGPAAARREVARPAPEPRSSVGLVAGDPLRELGMRVTYRTVRVLMAVAANPESSNRVVADSAGIQDQGQISKLLGRLERFGLVKNVGLGRGMGAPNAWTLTDSGRRAQRTISTDSYR